MFSFSFSLPSVNWVGLAYPILYLGTMVGLLYTFSSWYRTRKLVRAHSLAPWFDQHRARDIYLSLLHHEPAAGQPKIPDSVLKAALLRRAIENVNRVIAIRNSKQGLATLLQRGSIGDELWQRFLRAEQEIEEEIRDVVNEANAFAENWGQIIFQSANEMAMNQRLRKGLEELQAAREADKEWWEKKRASISDEFMKELEAESGTGKTQPKTSDDEAVLVEAGGPTASQQQGGGKKKKKGKH